MNPAYHDTQSIDTASDSGVVVAIHFALPVMPRLDLFLWAASPKAFSQYGLTLGFALRHAGFLESGSGLGVHGTFRNGMMLFRTEQRNEAIKLVREFLNSTCGDVLELNAPFALVEIAYQTADGVWFTFQPQGHQEPFSRWFDQESKAERDDRSENAESWMDLLIRELVRQCPTPPSLPPAEQ